LQPVEIGVSQAAKIGLAGCHQILLGRPDPVIIVVKIVEAADRTAKPLARALEDRLLQRVAGPRRDQKAQRVGWPVQLAVRDRRVTALVGQAGAEMPEIVERGGKEPGPEAVPRTANPIVEPLPDQRAAIALRPHRNNSRRGIPAEEPFVLDVQQRIGGSHRPCRCFTCGMRQLRIARPV
jgi:hypothetical protein